MNDSIEKNPILGQVWTPDNVAKKMALKLLSLCRDAREIHILDPAAGPATFARSIFESTNDKNFSIDMYDVDSRMVDICSNFCEDNKISGSVFCKDYILAENTKKYDAIIMNPPYIRQENISLDRKDKYHEILKKMYGKKINKRANLFAIFLLKALADVKDDGYVIAIVYDAISSSLYGQETLSVLSEHANLISEESVSAPFGDVLIDAKILCWQKTNAPQYRKDSSDIISSEQVPLCDLLNIARGTALPYRKVFVARKDDPYYDLAEPFFLKQKDCNVFICEQTERAYFSIISDSPLYDYLQKRLFAMGLATNIKPIKKQTGKICFNYYLRDFPRHLFNIHNYPISDNFYVSTPKNDFPPAAAWLLLNSNLFLNAIIKCARNQGSGLIKLQAYEYKKALVPNWALLTADIVKELDEKAQKLLSCHFVYADFRDVASHIAEGVFK